MAEQKTDLEKTVEVVESKLNEAVERYEGQVKETGEATKKVAEDLKAMATEHADLMKDMPELKERFKEVEQRIAEGPASSTQKRQTWGEVFSESDSFKDFKEGGKNARARAEVKNTILGESGSPGDPSDTLVQSERLPGIIPGAFRALNVLDFVPTGATASNSIEYTREASWTNSGAETNEGATKPESDLTFELVNDPVRTVAHIIKASKQILDDAPMLQSYIDRRMEHGIRKRLQEQVLKGDGSSPNLSGLSDTGRHTTFTPETGEHALDSLNRAKYAIIGADYMPNFIWMNPTDFGAIERLKEATDSDKYLASDGAALSYINGGMTPLIWGLPVATSNDIASGKFYMGDSNAFQLFMRQGATVEMFEQDETNVQKNLLTIRAELRAAFAVYVSAAVRYGDLTL